MLAKCMYPVALLTVLLRSSLGQQDTTNNAPLLTAISEDPELSTFYSLLNSTGGASGIPGPPFEERFNNLTDGRKFTAFAPVNSAFEALPPGLAEALTAPATYSLLEAILRTHIVGEMVTEEDVRTSGKSVESIEGIPLTFQSEGDAVVINNQTRLTSMDSTTVGNGAIFKITSVIDPLVEIFGTDVAGNLSAPAAPHPGPSNSNSEDGPEMSGTIASALASSPNLTMYMDFLNATAPDFFSLLDGSLPNGKNLSIFAPCNKVFQALGEDSKLLQPSNQPFASYLLKYPFIRTTSAGRDESIVGFPATVRRDDTGAIVSVNNAVVSGEKICVSGACVYTVERWLDPAFGLF